MLPPPARAPWEELAAAAPGPSWRPAPVWSEVEEGGMDAPAWLARWQRTAALTPVTAVRHLLYLGATRRPEVCVYVCMSVCMHVCMRSQK